MPPFKFDSTLDDRHRRKLLPWYDAHHTSEVKPSDCLHSAATTAFSITLGTTGVPDFIITFMQALPKPSNPYPLLWLDSDLVYSKCTATWL